MGRMNTRSFRSTLETHGIAREVSDAIVELVEDSRADFVTNDKLELEMTKLRSELRSEISELRLELKGDISELRHELKGDIGRGRQDFAGLETKFAEHKTYTTRLVLGTSGALGLLMIMLRFLPA